MVRRLLPGRWAAVRRAWEVRLRKETLSGVGTSRTASSWLGLLHPGEATRDEKGLRMTDHATSSTPGAGATSEASTTEQVKDQARDKAQVAKDKARGALGQARGQFRDQVDQRSTQAGERLTGTAADARSIAEELHRQGKDTPARMVEQVAGQAERLGDYLKGASGDHIMRDVEDFARSRPWLVAAGGLVLGFAGSRFLKASSGRRYRSYGTDRFATYTGGYPRRDPDPRT
jgi:ElaB/YqjD/DUF883 family membrane-anchored ribosome-binding protein